MSSAAEHPKLESRPRPERKEESGDELTDVRCNSKVLLEPNDDTEIYKVIQPHKQDEFNNLIRCLSLAGFIAKHPVFVDDKKQNVGANARNGDSKPRCRVEDIVSDSIADIRPPKQDISRNLQLDKLPDSSPERLFCLRFHFKHKCNGFTTTCLEGILKVVKTKAKTIRYWLLISLIFTAPMSFTPSIALPVFDFPSFRIGLYQVLAVLFVLSCAPLFAKGLKRLSKSRLFVAGAVLFALVFSIGLATTSTFPRTVLYSASLVSLLLLGISGYFAWRELTKHQRETAFTSLLWSGVVFGSLAIIQLVVASFDKTALGTLCTGCSGAVFGFPRINLFAAEPQFFANSLLPALFASFFFRSNKRLANWALVLTSVAIGLTFSRGAFLAIAVSVVVYIIIQLIRKDSIKSFLQHCCIMVASILVAFALLIGSAAIRYRETPYIVFNTTVSMLDHISMGTINISQKTSVQAMANNNPSDDFIPEGYVAASSNDRLDAASLALNAWNDSSKNILFGVGMGNLGAYVNEYVSGAPSNLTVYIWYILVLAELGIVGLTGLLLAPAYLLWKLVHSNLSAPPFALAFTVTVAFLIQLFSFGSYINSMYQYLFIGIFLAVLSVKPALRAS